VTFKEVLAPVVEWLQHGQWISSRAPKRQFARADEYPEDRKVVLIDS
jgi:hypothetical protein